MKYVDEVRKLVDRGEKVKNAAKKVAQDKTFTEQALQRAYHRAIEAQLIKPARSHASQLLTNEQELGVVTFLVYCANMTAVASTNLVQEFVKDMYNHTVGAEWSSNFKKKYKDYLTTRKVEALAKKRSTNEKLGDVEAWISQYQSFHDHIHFAKDCIVNADESRVFFTDINIRVERIDATRREKPQNGADKKWTIGTLLVFIIADCDMLAAFLMEVELDDSQLNPLPSTLEASFLSSFYSLRRLSHCIYV